jgi:hypothetical protein
MLGSRGRSTSVAKLTRLGTCGRYPNCTGTFWGAPRPAGETLMPPSPSMTGSPSRRLVRAFRISVALAIIAATSWLMTHQAQAPSVFSDRPPTNGTAGVTRDYIEDGAKPVGATAGTRMVDARTAHASETNVKFSAE